MSDMYYALQKIVERITSETKEKHLRFPIKWASIYFLGATSILVCGILFLEYPEMPTTVNDILLIGGSALLIISEMIQPRYMKYKKTCSTAHLVHISEMRNAFIAVGFDSKEKIRCLQTEIKNIINKEDLKFKQMVNVISKIFLYMCWFPAGFMLALWMKANARNLANADPIIILPFFLFLLKTFLVVIGAFFLCRGLALLFIKSIRMQRMLILSYLNAVLHYAKPESGDKLPEINMDYSIVDIEKTSHIKSFLKKYFPKLFGSESKPLCIKLLERCPLWHKLSEVTHPETKPDASTAIPTPDRDLEKAPSCIKLLDQCPLWCKLNEAAPPETASTNPKPDCDPTS